MQSVLATHRAFIIIGKTASRRSRGSKELHVGFFCLFAMARPDVEQLNLLLLSLMPSRFS